MQDPELQKQLDAMSIGFLLALERKAGRASHIWPYLALLPDAPQCLWVQASNEAAGLAKIARRAGEKALS